MYMSACYYPIMEVYLAENGGNHGYLLHDFKIRIA